MSSISSTNFRAKISIDAYISKDFTVTKAFIVLSHFPLEVNYQGQNKGTGYSRKVKVYKETSSNMYKVWNVLGDFFDIDSSTYNEISDSGLGSNGWTPNLSEESRGLETVVTEDIKEYISNGINRFIIQSSEDIPDFSYDTDYPNNQINCALKTGMISATLYVYGFMKPN